MPFSVHPTHHGLSDTMNHPQMLISVTFSPAELFPANMTDCRLLLDTAMELFKVGFRISSLGKLFGADKTLVLLTVWQLREPLITVDNCKSDQFLF